MAKLKLTIITPKQVILEKMIEGVSLPSPDGEMTILPRHINLFSLVDEGIVRYWVADDNEYLAIGGGYVETDGENVRLLVSRAYGQDHINEKKTQEALETARAKMKNAKTVDARKELDSLMRRSAIDSKLLKKKKRVAG